MKNGLISRSINRGDDAGLKFGGGGPVELKYNVDDANANVLMALFSEGGAVDVPVFVLGDVTADKDLGWFNGITEPQVGVVDDDGDSSVTLGCNGDDDARILLYGSAALTLPALTLGGTLTLNGQTLDAGSDSLLVTSTGDGKGIEITNTTAGYGAKIIAYHNSSSPGNNDAPLAILAYGEDSASNKDLFHVMSFRNTNVASGSETAQLRYEAMDSSTLNLAMTVSGAGEVGGDLAYAEFDRWDDKAIVQQLKTPVALREQSIAKQFADMGIATHHKDRIRSGGYMLNLQKAFWFNFHALKVAYNKIDKLEEQLSRIS